LLLIKPWSLNCIFRPFKDFICSPSDILEPRKQGAVRVAIMVNELLSSAPMPMQTVMMSATSVARLNMAAAARGGGGAGIYKSNGHG
jgi:hypothetical protein